MISLVYETIHHFKCKNQESITHFKAHFKNIKEPPETEMLGENSTMIQL